MSRFTQLHVLTFYPPSNLNRDDMGRPKTAVMGGEPRLRISSQCLKRAWRTSDVFQEALQGNVGTRTKEIIKEWILPHFEEGDQEKKSTIKWAQAIAGVFAKIDKKNELATGQLVHYTPKDEARIKALAQTISSEKRAPTAEELKGLFQDSQAVDISLFGRMLADNPSKNVDAAVQASHALTVNRVAVEDDFFTAVDDLNAGAEDLGAGHLDENWFGSGVFYLYVNINRDLLTQNLDGDAELAGRSVRALTEAIATVSPHGKQNSFAALSRAGYTLAEKGESQPRSLAVAFMEPIDRGHILDQAVQRLKEQREKLDIAYETMPDDSLHFYPANGEGKLSNLLNFVAEA